ncbi:peptide deformylase [Sulfurimonas sp. HSL3-7]|uniref:peptide deformylase n=1 Tax=Sulfonitrofixus jiaomeiensis TaxID=3131938 RepID=UPI0031F92814
MILPIVTYPDKRLKTISEPVTDFNEELHTFLDDMYETMIKTNGIGLAAIQVDRPIQVLIINLPNDDEEGLQDKVNLLEIINPKLTHSEGTTSYQEGCLSVPKFYEDVERFEKIAITYQDRHGNACSLEADELLSIAVQHEMDHLQGKLFIEKLSYARRKKFEKEYKKLLKEKKR